MPRALERRRVRAITRAYRRKRYSLKRAASIARAVVYGKRHGERRVRSRRRR